MKQLPLLSVIVPVYRVEAYLDTCVSSILSQTYENLEVILVDDGSPDNSGHLCDRWAEKDSRVRVIHQKNAGGGAARNAGLDAAQGQLIAFVDSDDYLALDMFAFLYDLMEQGADIAECDYLMTEQDQAAFDKTSPEPQWYSTEEAMACHIADTAFCQLLWNKLYRRETIGDIRLPVGTRIDDEFFTYQVLGNARRLVRANKKCYAYRQQPGSVMHQKNPVKKLEGLRAKQQRLEFLREKLPGLVNVAKVELMLACIYALQTILRDMEGTAKQQAVSEVRDLICQLQPLNLDGVDSPKQKIMLKAAVRYPEAVAKTLNFLIDIHVLT